MLLNYKFYKLLLTIQSALAHMCNVVIQFLLDWGEPCFSEKIAISYVYVGLLLLLLLLLYGLKTILPN